MSKVKLLELISDQDINTAEDLEVVLSAMRELIVLQDIEIQLLNQKVEYLEHKYSPLYYTPSSEPYRISVDGHTTVTTPTGEDYTQCMEDVKKWIKST